MRSEYEFAYSPCPNDTYAFAAFTNGLLKDAPSVRVTLLDIEELNDAAAHGRYAFTKVSYGAIPYLADRYRILRSGGALGRGCGPLLVARPDTGAMPEDFAKRTIAIPGERTTAFLMLQLLFGVRPRTVAMRFDRIIPAVAAGEVDAGLIIHESRFTYRASGLNEIVDLGDWWERTTGSPIPLGAILVRNDVPGDVVAATNGALRDSLAYARRNEQAVMSYVRAHAFEMSDDVMRKHIDLYVNDYTTDISESGMNAVRTLFARARAARLIPATSEAAFA